MKLSEYLASLKGGYCPGTNDVYQRFPVLSKPMPCPACNFMSPIPFRKVLHCMLDSGWNEAQIIAWLELNKLDHEELK